MSAQIIVVESVNEDILVCGLCKALFNTLEPFLEHKRLCQQNIQCVLTNQIVFSNEPALVVTNPNESLFSFPLEETTDVPSETVQDVEHACTVCGKTFKRKRGLIAHIRSHSEKPHQCLVCGRCFIQKSHLQRHILTHKVWPESLSDTTPKCTEEELLCYSCQYCPLIFSNYSQYRSHLAKHQSVKKFKCIQGDCQEFFETLEMLLHHVPCSHITPLYCCHICYKQFESLESIAAHEVSHNVLEDNEKQTRQYKCSQCDAVFTKPEKLSLHMINENHKKACIHCQKTFASDKRLRLHLQTHRILKQFQCNICNKCFLMKKYLATHMLKHGTKEFQCPICLCHFNRPDILRRHMKTHSTSKLPCPFKDTLNCKREFTRKDKLKLHLRTHKPTQQPNYNPTQDSINM